MLQFKQFMKILNKHGQVQSTMFCLQRTPSRLISIDKLTNMILLYGCSAKMNSPFSLSNSHFSILFTKKLYENLPSHLKLRYIGSPSNSIKKGLSFFQFLMQMHNMTCSIYHLLEILVFFFFIFYIFFWFVFVFWGFFFNFLFYIGVELINNECCVSFRCTTQ